VIYRLSKSFTFEAAHHLPQHDGKCRNVHGHSWVVTVTFEGKTLQPHGPQEGMLLDYYQIGQAMRPIIEDLDHRNLNEYMSTPTSENMAAYIAARLVGEARVLPDGIVLHKVTINETCTSACELILT
jgi:6-pyruvoyltetrahydropterin/6-carboxytetrahydropterin synthase